MTHTYTYTTMDVLVIDRRNGDVITDLLQQAVDAAECVIYIDPDGHIETVMRADIKTVRVNASFATALHRDEVSAAKSREAYKPIEEAKSEIEPAHTPAEQFENVWKDSPNQDGPYPGNHGNVNIRKL